MTTRQSFGSARRGGPPRRRGRPRHYARRRVCRFCVDHLNYIDYKNVEALRRYLNPRQKMEARRKTGVCAKHQRGLSTAIKRARHLAMLPFSTDHRFEGARIGR